MNRLSRNGGVKWIPDLRAALTRTLLFAILWVVVSEGKGGYPLLAVGVVVVAAGASLWLLPAREVRLSWRGLASFAPHFVREAVSGGLDVAGRAFRPTLPIDPAFVEIELRGSTEASRVITADAMSVLPGTLSARLDGSTLTLHILDQGLPYESQLREIERLAKRVVGPRAPADRP